MLVRHTVQGMGMRFMATPCFYQMGKAVGLMLLFSYKGEKG